VACVTLVISIDVHDTKELIRCLYICRPLWCNIQALNVYRIWYFFCTLLNYKLLRKWLDKMSSGKKWNILKFQQKIDINKSVLKSHRVLQFRLSSFTQAVNKAIQSGLLCIDQPWSSIVEREDIVLSTLKIVRSCRNIKIKLPFI